MAAGVDYEGLSRKALKECVGATGMRWPSGVLFTEGGTKVGVGCRGMRSNDSIGKRRKLNQ